MNIEEVKRQINNLRKGEQVTVYAGGNRVDGDVVRVEEPPLDAENITGTPLNPISGHVVIIDTGGGTFLLCSESLEEEYVFEPRPKLFKQKDEGVLFRLGEVTEIDKP